MITTEIWVERAKKKFPQFDYSKVVYVRNDEKVEIVCPEHGIFYVTPSNFMHYKYGCPKCKTKDIKLTKEEFIRRSKEKFGDKFDYSKVEYINRNIPVTLICPIHGEFSMLTEKHLNSPTGCPECSRSQSKKKSVDGKDRKTMREYSIWKGMKTRVTNPNTDDSDRYISRGITCCQEWIESFEKFYEDMGPCPEGFTLDRIDPNGDYCLENCRWADKYTQAQNRGEFNLVFTYNGETHVLKEWARILNIKYSTLYNRLTRSKMSFEEAISRTPDDLLTEFNGEKKTLKEWSKIYNIKYQTVINRLNKHKWSLKDALTIPLGGRRKKT